MSGAAKRSVEVFYDVVSPYSWIGFEAICRYRSVWNINLKLKPVFLGGIMNESGNRPPGLVMSKGAYMMKDLDRLAKHYQIPLNQISDFVGSILKKGSLPSQRFITAIDMVHPDKTEALSREFWMRLWSRDEDIVAKESLIAAGKAIGLSDAVIEDALSKLKSDEVKGRLKEYTSEALQHGAFGAPSYLVEDSNGKKQLVFGSDRFHIMADILGEKYPGPMVELASKL